MEMKKSTNLKLKQYSKNMILAIQHSFAMLGATVLVPIICNLSISIALICAGLGTIIFYLVTKRRVPVFLGSSFAFIPAITGVIPPADKAPIGSELWLQSVGKMSVAILFVGLVYIIIAVLIKFIGVKKISALFPPVVVGPIVAVIGLNLAPVVFSSYIKPSYMQPDSTNPAKMVPNLELKGKVWAVVVVTALVIICMAVFARKGFLSTISVLCGMLAGYILAASLGIIDYSPIKQAGWIIGQGDTSKVFTFYKYMKFDFNVVMMFIPLALVTISEHLGDISVNSAIVGKNFMEEPGLHRTILGDGLATAFAGFVGGPCNTTYGENSAVLAITKNYNPNVLALAGGVAILLGIFGKIGGIIQTIPMAVIGGASLILFGMITANGLKVLVDNKVDLTKARNSFTVALILVIGIGMGATGMTLELGKDFKVSPLALVTIIGILINQIFNLSEYINKKLAAKKNKEQKEDKDIHEIL